MGQNWDRGDTYSAMEVLRYIAEFLDGLPGRKNLIWFSGTFPLALFPSDEDVPDYAQEVKATLDLVAQDQIAIYPVDVRGVVVTDWKATDGDPGGAADTGGAILGAQHWRILARPCGRHTTPVPQVVCFPAEATLWSLAAT